jgi:hypothetical protein
MGGDSNPRCLLGTHAFQACTIDRSVTHPLPVLHRSGGSAESLQECRRNRVVQAGYSSQWREQAGHVVTRVLGRVRHTPWLDAHVQGAIRDVNLSFRTTCDQIAGAARSVLRPRKHTQPRRTRNLETTQQISPYGKDFRHRPRHHELLYGRHGGRRADRSRKQ